MTSYLSTSTSSSSSLNHNLVGLNQRQTTKVKERQKRREEKEIYLSIFLLFQEPKVFGPLFSILSPFKSPSILETNLESFLRLPSQSSSTSIFWTLSIHIPSLRSLGNLSSIFRQVQLSVYNVHFLISSIPRFLESYYLIPQLFSSSGSPLPVPSQTNLISPVVLSYFFLSFHSFAIH